MATSESGGQWSVEEESENDPQPRAVPHPMSPPAKPSTMPRRASSSVCDESERAPAFQLEAEQQYKKRFESLRSIYEGRIAAMSAQLRATYRDIETDQVLVEMRADPASGAFVRSRIAEMVEHTLEHEREAHIVRLSEQYAEAQNAIEKGEQAQRALDAQSARCAELESELRELREVKEQARKSHERAIIAEAEVNVLQARQRIHSENVDTRLLDADYDLSQTRERHTNSKLHSATTNIDVGVLGPAAHASAQRLNQLVASVASLQAAEFDQRKENAELRVQCEQARVDRDDVTQLLRKSEAERLALRAKYIEVGERMEVVLEEEAHERYNTEAALQQRLKRYKARLVEESEKHRIARVAARSAEEQVDKLKAERSAIAKEFAQFKERADNDRAVVSRDADALEQQLTQLRDQAQARDAQMRQQISARDEQLAQLRTTHERTVLRLQQQAQNEADRAAAEREERSRTEWEATREQQYHRLEAELREQFELTTGRKQVNNEFRGAQSAPVPQTMAPPGPAAMPFCAIDDNIDHLQTQFEARLRELEDKKDAELRTAMKNMASGVRKLEQQLKVERAANEELKQDLEQKQAQIKESAKAVTKPPVMGGSTSGDSTGADASNGALVEHLRESNASIVRLKQMLLEQKAKVHSAENNVKTLTLKLQEAQKQWQAREDKHAELMQQAECDSVDAREAAAAARDRLQRLSLECPMLRNALSAMRRELSRTRDHANEMLGHLNAEVASGIESVVQRAKSQQAAAQQHIEEHWIDKLQQSQRQLENTRVEWATERANATAKLDEAERGARSACELNENLTQEVERVRAEADQLPHVRRELQQNEKKLKDTTRQLKTSQVSLRQLTERYEQKRCNFRSVLLALSSDLHFSHELQSGLLGDTQEHFDACLRLLHQRVAEHTRAQREEAKQEVIPQLQQLRDAHQELQKRRDRAEQHLEESQRQVDEAKSETHACKLQSVKLQQELAELRERERALNDEIEKARADMSMMGELQQMERDSQVRSLQAQLDEAQRRHEEARRDWEVSLEAQLDETKERVLEEQHRNRKTRADEAQQHKVELADEAQQHKAQRLRLTEQIMTLQHDKRTLEKRLNDATRELGVKKREAERHQRRHKEAVAQVDELHEQLQDQLSRSRQLASAASESCFDDGPASLSILGSSTPVIPRRGVRNFGVSREVGSTATPASMAKRAGLIESQVLNQAFDAPGSTDAKMSDLALASS